MTELPTWLALGGLESVVWVRMECVVRSAGLTAARIDGCVATSLRKGAGNERRVFGRILSGLVVVFTAFLTDIVDVKSSLGLLASGLLARQDERQSRRSSAIHRIHQRLLLRCCILKTSQRCKPDTPISWHFGMLSLHSVLWPSRLIGIWPTWRERWDSRTRSFFACESAHALAARRWCLLR